MMLGSISPVATGKRCCSFARSKLTNSFTGKNFNEINFRSCTPSREPLSTSLTCRSNGEAIAPVGNDGKYFWQIVIPTGLALLLCNMDRICMSVAVLPMSQTFGWSPKVQGMIQAAFLWGYMATQLWGGKLADTYGGKRVIAIAIVFFSLASLALPLFLKVVSATPALQQFSATSTLACVVIVRFLGNFLLIVNDICFCVRAPV